MSPIDHKGKVVITRFEALRDEISFIKGEIIELVNNNKVDSWGNIAILMRSVSSYGQYYLDALKTANIPYIAKGGRSLFNTAEVSIIVMFLEWLIKEPNTVQNLIIIKNIFNGKLNEELIHLNNTEIGMLSKNKAILFGLTENDFTNLTKLIKIRERYQMRKFNSILEIIFDFISYMKLLAKDTPESKAYNIAQFTQIVREYEEISQNKKIEYLCGYLVSYAQNAFDEASPIEEAINAVNVLTIHQAKGLEYDYVFIPMLVEHRFPVHTRQNRWLIDDNLFKANRYYNTEENERRLFYVACTRAKKGLYLLSSKDVGLINLKKPSKYYQEASHVLLPDKNEIPLSKSKKTIAKRYLVSSYSSLEYYLTCPYRYRLVVKYGLAFPLNPFLEFGQLIHIVMGFMNHSFSKGKMLSFPEIKEYYDKIFDKYFYNANVPHYVINKQKVRGLRAIQNYYNQKQDWFINVVDVEKDFEYISEKYLIRGRYDLLLKLNNNKYIIVDYKTGQPHEYLRTDFQMQLYSIAALEQLQIPVDSAILYYLESGHEKLYKINEAFLNEGRKNLNNVVDGILSENYDATPGKMCVRCEVKEFCSEHS
jgi:DNA helicase-2/ATP-dependent DNA helicase PcrA